MAGPIGALNRRRAAGDQVVSDAVVRRPRLPPRVSAGSSTRPVSKTLRNYGRGLVGGMIFAFAPLYTMEVWEQGFIARPAVVLFAVVATYAVLVAYSFYAGLHADRSLAYNLAEAFESLALGFVISFVVLKLIGQLPGDLPPVVYLTRLTLEGLASAIGVAVGSSQLGQDPDDTGEGQPHAEGGLRGLVHQVAYSVLGATLIIAGVAPTAEVVVTGIEAPIPAVPATAVLSFLVALAVVHHLDFRGAGRSSDVYAGGAFGDAVVTYAIGIVCSAVLLWSVGRFDGVGLGAALSMVVYLAWPATLGAAVGRLLL